MDLSNSSLLVSYDDGTTKTVEITPSMISDFKTNVSGNYTFYINYLTYKISVNYTVSKKNPIYTIPILDDVVYVSGMKLSDVILPEGFTWNNPNVELSFGSFDYLVTYTPSDTNVYNIVNNISVKVNVVTISTPILIYEVYGGGGNTNAIYNQDYIVLYNTTSNNINLKGYSIQYSSETSYSVLNLSGIIYAKNYYVIGLSKGSNGLPLPVAVNISFSTNLSLDKGKVALVSNTDTITSINDEDIIDFLGFGSVNEYEGSAGLATSNTTSIKRKTFTDNNNNRTDFIIGTPDLGYIVDSLKVISIEAFNLKTHYNLGSSLNLGGSYLLLGYSNGSYGTTSIENNMVSGFDSSRVGTGTLEITYQANVITFEYYIVDYSSANEANVYYIDIGASGGKAGESSLIKVGDVDVLIDAGDSDSSSTSQLLQFLGTQVTDGVIEYVIATHPDSDHIGGMMEVFNQYEIANVIRYSTDASISSGIRTNFEAAIVNENANHYDVYQLATSSTPYINLSSSVRLTFYNTTYLTTNNANASSIVFVLEAFETRVLFNGDAESSQEQKYAPLVGDVDIFKMGHHGSSNGTSAYLLQTIKPEVAIVSNGNYLGNSYKHPTFEAVKRIYEYSNNIPVYAVTGGNGAGSDINHQRNGDIRVVIDNDGYSISSSNYGNNPIELSATDYWKSSSNPYSSYFYYYRDVTGMKLSSVIKQILHDIIDDHVAQSYDFATEALMKTDEDSNNPNNVILFYTGRSQAKSSHGSSGDKWNREHVWAKSHGGFGTSKPAGSDLHHLRPTDASVNNERGSLDFDNGGSKVIDTYGEGSSFCYVDHDSFEPRDEVKGDVARILFYMVVRYEGDVVGEPDLELNDKVNNGSAPLMGRLSVLLQWHEQDPVDDFERNRNNVIYSYQKNRNPFIDHPEWVKYIFTN